MTQHHHKLATLAQAGAGKPTTSTEAAVASSDIGNDHTAKLVSDEDIRLAAYQKWEAAGKPAGDGVQFWLQAEQELLEGRNEKLVQRDGWHGHREHERPEATKAVKERDVIVDSHYRDNNRMFQSHGDRGHRHGGSG
ncbi:MAG TPA: DUF2934 domain-containing protein [Gemmataceae bacterium]|nr:DUF2934 domain-containing protein [Gemmataceae bacterium]